MNKSSKGLKTPTVPISSSNAGLQASVDLLTEQVEKLNKHIKKQKKNEEKFMKEFSSPSPLVISGKPPCGCGGHGHGEPQQDTGSLWFDVIVWSTVFVGIMLVIARIKKMGNTIDAEQAI